MTRKDYDAFCKSLPHATHVVQWGDASVWKIGGKVFAIGGWSDGETFAVTLQVLEDELRDPERIAGRCGRRPISPPADFRGCSASTTARSTTRTSGIYAAELRACRRRLAEANPARPRVDRRNRTSLNRRSVGAPSHGRRERQL